MKRAIPAFGGGTGPIVLDDVQCVGADTLFECFHCGIGNHNCYHFEYAGVKCLSGEDDSTTGIQVNLVEVMFA